MKYEIEEEEVGSIDEVIKAVMDFEPTDAKNPLYFRGESQDFHGSALQPSIYRTSDLLEREHEIYREMQRFNDQEFISDKTAFDKLSRMQHYQAPTRLLDLSEDVLSALYFAVRNRDKSVKSSERAILYLLEIDNSSIKYYDSDSVSVVANLAKSPLLDGETKNKSKSSIMQSAKKYLADIVEFNETESAKFLLHDIKEEKSYFSHIVKPKHIFSVFFVKPKFSNDRLHGQKGAFLVFGLNYENVKAPIQLIEYTDSKPRLAARSSPDYSPIVKIKKLILANDITFSKLEKLGVTTPFIFPEMDEVAGYLRAKR